MKLTLTNFRRIKSALLELSPITLLMGPNGGGKTSILQAIAALTAGVYPVPDLLKNQVKQLIHDGEKTAEIILSDKGITSIKYPEGKRTVDGCPFEISSVAAGYEGFLSDARAADRVKRINSLMESEPTREDLLNAGVQLLVVDRLWQTILAQGWDAAHSMAKDKGVELKGAWKQVTGHNGNYGAQIAEEWLPDVWTPDLLSLKDSDLKYAILDANNALESAISEMSVSDAETSRLEAAAVLLPRLETEQKNIEIQYAALQKLASETKTKIQPERRLSACPWCNKTVEVKGTSLFKPSSELKPSDNTAKNKLDEVSADITKTSINLGKLKQQIFDCERSREQLAKISGKKNGVAQDIEKLRADVKFANARLEAWQAYRQAKSKHAAIQENQKLIDILAPDGLRMVKIAGALMDLNTSMASICEAARWEQVKILPDMSVTYA